MTEKLPYNNSHRYKPEQEFSASPRWPGQETGQRKEFTESPRWPDPTRGRIEGKGKPTEVLQWTTNSRLMIAGLLGIPFPTRLNKEHSHLEKIDAMLTDGYSMVLVLPHFSYRDFLNVAQEVFKKVKIPRKRKFLTPITAHQARKKLTQFVMNNGRNEPAVVVNPDSDDAEQRYLAEIKKKAEKKHWSEAKIEKIKQKKIWWKHEKLTPRKSYANYLRDFKRTMREGGVAMVAPQGGRRGRLQHFEGKPIEHLMGQVKDIDKVAFCPIGIKVRGADDYSKSKLGRYNPLKKYEITFGEPVTAQGLKQRAEEANSTVDDIIFEDMNALAPKPYQAEV